MKLTCIVLFAMSLFGFSAKAEPLAVGSAAPVISATNQDGEPVDFAKVYAKGTTLVYFYPKAGTPGCTAQACSLRDSFTDLSEEGLQILGVSADKPESQKNFQQQNNLPFPLIADTDGKVAAAFGVPTTMGIAKRQSFLVSNGKIVWTSLQAKTAEHAQEVRSALRSIK
ncbi:MAG TPA: peroxiredoxin [Terrimicrobiaceae bacterium]|nr:peroxiredoxin [Terrimicrobiaceae bacterium]